MGPCRSVSADYSACLLRNSPKWQGFFGVHPERITAALANRIEQFRAIERSIAELHRTVLEIGSNVTDRCLLDFTQLKYCPQCFSKSETSNGLPAAPCADYCKKVMTSCWTVQTADWDRSIQSLLRKSGEFNGAFDEVNKIFMHKK